MTSGPRSGEYLFSSETLGRLDEIYAGLKDLPELNGHEDFYAFYTQSPGHLLPPKWYPFIGTLPAPFRTEIQGQAVWQWIALGVLFALALTGLFLALRAMQRMSKGTPARIVIASIVPPALVALTATVVMYVADFEINISGSVEATLNDLAEGVSFLALIWGIVALSNALAHVIEQSPGIRRESIDASLDAGGDPHDRDCRSLRRPRQWRVPSRAAARGRPRGPRGRGARRRSRGEADHRELHRRPDPVRRPAGARR